MRRLLVLACVVLVGATAYADTIAMLPLDGEKRLEIYGQPVAAEIARALKAAGLDVVVVGARMGVPDGANLIVDGTIKATKNKQIELAIRIRDPRDGTTLETVPAATTKLDNLDKAAAELSARVVPSVKAQLEALAKKAAGTEKPITEPKPLGPPKPRPPTPDAATLVAIVMPASKPELALLRNELDREAVLWAATRRDQTSVRFAVISYSVKTADKVPMARARVHVKIGDSECGAKGRPTCRFDRVMRTDTIVGDKDAPPEKLAARTAREVLAILRPHLRRAMEH